MATPKPGGLGDHPFFTSQKLTIFDNFKPDKVVQANISNHNIAINHLTIIASSDAKKSAKKLIADALKRSYQSVTLNWQWVSKQNHALDTKFIDYAVQMIEMVAAADVVESDISLFLKFCQLDKKGTEKIANALATVPHLKSLLLMDTTDSFGLAVTEKLADAKNKLETFRIRKNSKTSFTLQAELSKAICRLIAQKPNLEKLDLSEWWGDNGYWSRIVESICASNIRYLNISKNVLHFTSFINLFNHAKKLKVLDAEFCVVQHKDLKDNVKFLQALKDNTTLRALNFVKTSQFEMNLLPDVLRTNTTLQSLKFSLGSPEYTKAIYERILEALKDNKTLLSFQCQSTYTHDKEQEVAEKHQSLHQFNKWKHQNLKQNAENYLTNRISITTFVIIFAKNSAKFIDWLPFELWLKIANYMNSPGLMDVEKRLLKTIEHCEHKNVK